MKPYVSQILHANMTADIYYSVGDRQTLSKLEALEMADYDNSRVQYHWKEFVFDQIQWQLEPTKSLEAMVDEHVRSIRESYDHVALWFSGGYDSYTILQAFVRNGLKIDELLLQKRDWHLGLNHLDFQTSLESARLVKQHWLPDTRITVVRWGDQGTVRNFYRKHGLDWIYHSAGLMRISQNNRKLLYEKNSSIQRSFERPGRNIQINGLDKPKIDLHDGKWYSTKPDSLFFQESSDWSLQFWFLPDLYVKQTWMMIRWLESLPNVDHRWVHALQSHSINDEMYKQWNLALGRNMPLIGFAQGMGHKPVFGNSRHSGEARPLLDVVRSNDPDIYQHYMIGVDHLEKIYKHLAQTNQYATLCSKKYYIKNFEPQERKMS